MSAHTKQGWFSLAVRGLAKQQWRQGLRNPNPDTTWESCAYVNAKDGPL